jgi:hypothetical protein
MGWVEKKFQDQRDSGGQQNAEARAAEDRFQQKAKDKWAELLRGFEGDVAEFRRITGRADFEQNGDSECRIASPQARIAVLVTADLPQHAIRYSYEPEDASTAVPQEGILTLRSSGSLVELFSADQQMSTEQARKLVLEPLLFPNKGASESSAA